MKYLRTIWLVSLGYITPPESYQDFVTELLIDTEDPQKYMYLGAISEIGEVADLLAKAMRPGRGLSVERLKDECGDVLFYLTHLKDENYLTTVRYLISTLIDLDFVFTAELLGECLDALDELAEFNVEKLTNRKKETGSHVK